MPSLTGRIKKTQDRPDLYPRNLLDPKGLVSKPSFPRLVCHLSAGKPVYWSLSLESYAVIQGPDTVLLLGSFQWAKAGVCVCVRVLFCCLHKILAPLALSIPRETKIDWQS